MVMFLKQSTSVDVGIGPFLDETDGKTAETALTITQPDIRLKKNGGAWAQKAAAQTLTHEENGWYEVTLDATDTDTIGHLLVAIHESGALPVWQEYHVLAANVYDSLFGAATDKLDVNVEEWNTTAVPAEHTAGYPIVTIKDGTGTGEINTNAGAVALVDLVTTLTTYTGNTPQTGDSFARLGAPVGASISADVAGVQSDTNDIQTRLPAALVSGRIDASVGAMAANVMTAAALAADAVTEIQSGLSTLSAAQVNAEVVDALATDTYAEPGQGTPAATTTLAAKINFLYKAWRNRHTQTATEYALYGDDAVTKDQEAAVSDDGVTFERAEITTGL